MTVTTTFHILAIFLLGFYSLMSVFSHWLLHIHFYILKCGHSHINYGYVCEIMDVNQWNESQTQTQVWIRHGDTSNLWKIITWNNQYDISMTQVRYGYNTLNEVFVLPRCKLVWKDIFLFLFFSTCFNITIRCVKVWMWVKFVPSQFPHSLLWNWQQ